MVSSEQAALQFDQASSNDTTVSPEGLATCRDDAAADREIDSEAREAPVESRRAVSQVPPSPADDPVVTVGHSTEDAAEMSGMTSRLILTYVEREGRAEAVAHVLADSGLSGREDELRDENAWFPFAVKIALFEAAAGVLDDDHIGRSVGGAALDLDIGDGVKRVLRALGTPGLIYRNIVRACAKFTWSHRMLALESGKGSARIRYEDISGVGYHRHDCDYNIGLLSTATELFGLPPARITHSECAVHGADACVYDIRWAAAPRLTTHAPSFVSAAAAASSVAALAGVAGALPSAAALTTSATLLGLRAVRARRRLMASLTNRLTQHDESTDRLAESMRDLGADLRPDEVLGKIVGHAQSATGGKEFALLTAGAGAKMTCVRATQIPAASLAALEAWASRSASVGEAPVIVDDLRGVTALAPLAREPSMSLGSLCAVPLCFQGVLMGVLIALARGPEAFLPHDAELLSSYAAQAAVTMHNAALVERLERMAHQDALTGLANQRHFHSRLAAEVNRCQRESTPLSLVLIDLDHFKRINDTHGHGRGDNALRKVGAALTGAVRQYDVAARLGGEEFCLILPNTADHDALELAERARAAVASVHLPGLTLTCSAGVAAWAAHTRGADGLLRCADRALYAAKRAGRNRTRLFESGVTEEHRGDVQAAQMRARLADPGALLMHFQPVMALGSGRIVAFEALARFPTLNGIRPDVAFRMAHEWGLGPELEALAIRRALEAVDRPSGSSLCVNASLSALASPNLWAELPSDLSDLVIEITEHELYESDLQLEDIVGRLRARGARIAVDDLGAGYAGLVQLARLKPEVIKLDRALVTGVAADPARAALIEAFVRFASSTGATVCAEGVESLGELRRLRDLDVTHAQGWAIARPGPAWPDVAAEARDVARGAEAGVASPHG